MRSATRVLMAGAALLALAGCSEAAQAAAAPSSVGPDYTEAVTDAFRATHPDGGDELRSPAVTADWSAFVATVSDLDPPVGEETTHNQMVAGFEAYVDAREGVAADCEDDHDLSGECMSAISGARDQWSAALDRAYELPGLSWDALLG